MSDATPVVRWDASATTAPGNLAGIASGSRYRPARNLSRVAGALVATTTALYAIDGLLSIYGVKLLSDLDHVTESELVAYDGVVGLVALAGGGLYILASIAVLAWVRRTVSNIPALTGDDAAHTPNMAVIWWFIPLANLIKPYEVVADVWRRLAQTPGQERTGRVRWWWIGFIVGGLIGQIYARLPMPTSVEEFNGLANLNVASDVLLIASGVLLVSMIFEIEARSRSRAALATQGGPISPFAVDRTRNQQYDSRTDRFPAYNAPGSAAPLGPPQG